MLIFKFFCCTIEWHDNAFVFICVRIKFMASHSINKQSLIAVSIPELSTTKKRPIELTSIIEIRRGTCCCSDSWTFCGRWDSELRKLISIRVLLMFVCLTQLQSSMTWSHRICEILRQTFWRGLSRLMALTVWCHSPAWFGRLQSILDHWFRISIYYSIFCVM